MTLPLTASNCIDNRPNAAVGVLSQRTRRAKSVGPSKMIVPEEVGKRKSSLVKEPIVVSVSVPASTSGSATMLAVASLTLQSSAPVTSLMRARVSLHLSGVEGCGIRCEVELVGKGDGHRQKRCR